MRGGLRDCSRFVTVVRPSPQSATMELFRSETMQLVQMIVPAEAAHDTVTALGEVGLVQFRDLNPDRSAFQRTYASQVKRCDEMLRKMRFFAEQMHKAGLVAVPRADAEDRAYHLDELEARLEELEHELRQITANTEKLRKSHSELVELQLVLEKAGGFFDDARLDAAGRRWRALEARLSTEARPLRDPTSPSPAAWVCSAAPRGRDAEMGESLLGANASGAHPGPHRARCSPSTKCRRARWTLPLCVWDSSPPPCRRTRRRVRTRLFFGRRAGTCS